MKWNVGVFFGGASCEHEISCISANQVLQALDKDKYNIIPIYVAKNMDLYIGDELWDLKNYGNLDTLCQHCTKISLVKDGNEVTLREVKQGLLTKKNHPKIDLAFLVMHGTNGEDGVLQGFMEMLQLPYTSSDTLGSAVGQDKTIMKRLLQVDDIPMVPWFYCLVSDLEKDPEAYQKKADELGYPLIIKPANLGSSIGIEIAHNAEEFHEKMRSAGVYDFKLVVEKMVEDLKEVNISVMGTYDEQKLSAIEEVVKNDEILSFENKYVGNAKSKGAKTKALNKSSKGMASTTRKIPADLSDQQVKTINKLAIKTFKALNAYGCVRIDFMIDKKTEEVYVNEINSIPGSLAFYLWQANGVNFSQECDELIANALKRYRDKQKKVFSFDTNILDSYGRK